MAQIPYAELHCHTNFSFLDGASPADELVERAVELGLTGLAVTDHNGLYGAVRFVGGGRGGRPPSGRRSRDRAARSGRPGSGRRRHPGPPPRGDAAGRPAADEPCPRRHRGSAPPAPPDAGPAARSSRAGQGGPARHRRAVARAASRAARPRPRRAGGACAGSSRGRTWPAPRPCRGSARPCSPSTPRASSRCRAVATARSRVGCGWAIEPGRGRRRERYATLFGRGDGPATSGFFIELSHHLLARRRLARVRSRRRWPRSSACRSSSPTTSTTRRPEDRELQDVLAAIRHGRTLDTLATCAGPTASRT